MNSAQRKVAAIGCWVAALAIVVAHASETWSRTYPGNFVEWNWLAWLGTFRYGRYEIGGLWTILLATLGAIAWTARGSRPHDSA